MSESWYRDTRPLRLENYLELQDFSRLRNFLDQATGISEFKGLYPDTGFGKNYVNISFHLDDNPNTSK